MCESLFQIGTLSIPSFGFFVLVGLILGSVLTYLRLRRRGMELLDYAALWGFSIGFGFLGAILFGFLFSHLDHVSTRSTLLGTLTLAVQGGLLVGLLAAVWMLRNLGRPVVESLALAVPPVFVGLAIGRLGCLFGGCCYGMPTDLPWGLVYPAGHVSHELYGAHALHPVPVYSLAMALALAVLAVVAHRRASDRFVLVWSLVLYLAGRFGLEMVRGDHGQVSGVWSLQQSFSVVTIVVLLVWYYRSSGRGAAVR